MKKISLHLDSLLVESFETTPADTAERGTVRGHATDTSCYERHCTCDETAGVECETDGCGTNLATCGASCTFYCSQSCPANTCAYSCEGTCGCPTWSPNETCSLIGC